MQLSDKKYLKRTFDYKVIFGPSFSAGLTEHEEWQSFKKLILNPNSLALAELWHEKALKAGGVPFRQDFSFREFVKFGSFIFLAKLNEENRWRTTYCGEGIVWNSGLEPTGKCLDEFGTPETLKFWLDNLKALTDESKIYLEFFKLEFTTGEIIHSTVINLPLKSKDSNFPDINLTYDAFTSESLAPEFWT